VAFRNDRTHRSERKAAAVDTAPVIRTSRLRPDQRGVWHIHFTVPDEANPGRWRSKTLCTRTRDQGIAEAILETWRDSQRQALRDDADYTVGDAIGLYLTDRSAGIGHTTVQCLEYMRDAIGTMKPREFDQAFVADWQNTRVNRRTGRSIASGSMLRELTLTRTALLYAAKRRKFDRNELHDDLLMPTKGAPRTRWLDEQEMQTVWDAACAQRDGFGLYVCIGMETAARKSAIAELTWDRVHLNAATPFIDFRNPHNPKDKNKRRPMVGISKKLLPLLTEAKRATNHTRLFPYPIRYAADVFFNALGLPGKVSLHTLRHSWATYKISKGAPLSLVAEIMGDTEEVVRRNYQHLVPHHTMNVLEL